MIALQEGSPAMAEYQLYCFAQSGGEYKNIAAWLGRIKALPGWAHPYDLMPGHPLAR
jgi:hypothetical protein